MIGSSAGDILTLYYNTFDPASTADELTALVGKQSEEVMRVMLADAS